MSINSGMGGNPYASNSIGGSLNMNLYKAGFHEESWKMNVNSGFETNGNYKILGAGIAYTSPNFYSNSGIFFRKSDNYLAGGAKEVNFSQFEKLNIMSNIGFRFSKNRIVEGSIIYDVASNVGYPALPMDVKLAKGLITSLNYTKEEFSDFFSKWETKVYFNNIKHIMDDTKRPDIPMHMDMPGKSRTGGFYSILEGTSTQDSYTINFDSYYNQSLAEMTMYPKDLTEKAMFMYTWPDVRTFNSGVFFEDKHRLSANNFLHISTKFSIQRDGVQSDFGFNALQIFYPNMERFKNRFLWNVSAKDLIYFKNIKIKIGGGYGLRAPSTSESYGYYLFNSSDNYDYIGNPQLKNESSWESNLTFVFTKDKLKFNLDASCFYLNNYIIGKPDKALSPMTINSSGVKVYQNIDHATIFNVDMNLEQTFLRFFDWTSHVSYSLGKDNNNGALPLIAPISYSSSLTFNKKRFNSNIKLQGAAKQYKYSQEYGESQTPAYIISAASLGYDFPLKKYILSLKIGIENVFDSKYSTYSDWNHIPQKGRNFYMNLLINCK
jgi:iron complex outermembrane receptor protein